MEIEFYLWQIFNIWGLGGSVVRGVGIVNPGFDRSNNAQCVI